MSLSPSSFETPCIHLPSRQTDCSRRVVRPPPSLRLRRRMPPISRSRPRPESERESRDRERKEGTRGARPCAFGSQPSGRGGEWVHRSVGCVFTPTNAATAAENSPSIAAAHQSNQLLRRQIILGMASSADWAFMDILNVSIPMANMYKNFVRFRSPKEAI